MSLSVFQRILTGKNRQRAEARRKRLVSAFQKRKGFSLDVLEPRFLLSADLAPTGDTPADPGVAVVIGIARNDDFSRCDTFAFDRRRSVGPSQGQGRDGEQDGRAKVPQVTEGHRINSEIHATVTWPRT